VITTGGKPVAKLVPADCNEGFIGRLKRVIRGVGEIDSPSEPPEANRSVITADPERKYRLQSADPNGVVSLRRG
jgi:antitoxin (DNA-binding transcriptional repressor) of toxin-antitoxin stability system